MALDYLLLDVFTDQPFGGNPLAVFTDASGLNGATMQKIARELSLSETAFVVGQRAPDDYSVRIFTPAMELPFAGHPTVGTAIALSQKLPAGSLPRTLRLALPSGLASVRVSEVKGRAVAELECPQLPKRITVEASLDSAAKLLGLSNSDLAGSPVAAYSAGVPFLFIELAGEEALNRAALDLGVWRGEFASLPAPHILAFTLSDPEMGREVGVRMFAPAMGIAEDPATGAAAAALAGWLIDRQKLVTGTHQWLIRQGEAMGRPSRIHLTAELMNGTAVKVVLQGTAVTVGRGSLFVD